MSKTKKREPQTQVESKLLAASRTVQGAIDAVSPSLTRNAYRTLLEELSADCEARLNALDDDEAAEE